MSIKLKEFWKAHDQKILIVLAIILTAAVSFRAGQTRQQGIASAEINVSLNQLAAANPRQEKLLTLGEAVERKFPNAETAEANLNVAEAGTAAVTAQENECVLVGSKNSDKYHLPSCGSVARIKPENRVCFSSEEDARAKGYQPAKDCFK